MYKPFYDLKIADFGAGFGGTSRLSEYLKFFT